MYIQVHCALAALEAPLQALARLFDARFVTSLLVYQRIKLQPLSTETTPWMTQVRDFKDTVYLFFESDTLFLEYAFGVVFRRLAILRIEGCLNSSP